MTPARTLLGLLPLLMLLVSTRSYVTMDEGMGIITEESYPAHGDNSLLDSTTTCPIPKCIGTVIACIPLCFSPNDACCRCLVRLDPSLDCCGCYWRKDGRFQSVCGNATCASSPTTTTTTTDWVTLDARTQDTSTSRRRRGLRV